jgi:hypothetical protein
MTSTSRMSVGASIMRRKRAHCGGDALGKTLFLRSRRLASFLDHRPRLVDKRSCEGGRLMKSTICIISVYRPDLMEEAIQSLGTAGNVQVIMDRRMGERRRIPRTASNGARGDRRHLDIEERLRTQGFAIVPRDED